MNIQLRKLNRLIQHFIILQLRHTTFITQSLKEIHIINDLWNRNCSLNLGLKVKQSVARLTADPGLASSIPARSHTFMEIDHEIISSSADSRRVVVSYKRNYVHEVLVNRMVKLAKENVWLGKLTV